MSVVAGSAASFGVAAGADHNTGSPPPKAAISWAESTAHCEARPCLCLCISALVPERRTRAHFCESRH